MVNKNFVRPIDQLIEEHITTIKRIKALRSTINQIARIIISAYQHGKKILVCGNGGSAADAQHLAAELLGRFEKNRPPLPCLALTTNTSLLTAIANDFSFADVFRQQVQAWGKEGDVLIVISTSGNSANILQAAKIARKQKMTVVGFTGKTGGRLSSLADVCLKIPSRITARIQEGHLLAIHILSRLVEEYFFG